MKLLIVEDEIRMAEALVNIFTLEGYSVDNFLRGDEGFEALNTGVYDIAVIDVMLPGMNGFDLVSTSRKNGIKTPILMLTAKSSLDDKVEGLDCGADDYLTKPFMVKELLARLRALARRVNDVNEGMIGFGDITLNMNTYTLTCKTTLKSVRLSEKEYKVFEYLISNSQRVITREQFAMKIWGFDSDTEYNNVEVYMSFARRKLQYIESKTEIKAIRGIGYELRY